MVGVCRTLHLPIGLAVHEMELNAQNIVQPSMKNRARSETADSYG